MAYITDVELEDKLDIPVCLPLTEIRPGDWLIVSTFRIPVDVPTLKATIRFLQLQMTLGATGDIAGVSLIKDYNVNNNPTVGAVENIQVMGPAPSRIQRNAYTPLTLDGRNAGIGGVYSFVAYSQASSPVEIAVVGSVRIDLNPQ
jgi:hypothetical protein